MDRSKDKGLIYTLIGLLVVVLLVAIGVIVYMGMKMMDMQKSQVQAEQRSRNRTVNVQEQVKKAFEEQMKQLKPQLEAQQNKQKSGSLRKEEIAAIVGIVMSQMQQSQRAKKELKDKDGNFGLDNELKKVVDGTDNGNSNGDGNNKKGDTKTKESDELESVLSVLESVDVDEVDENNIQDNVSLDSLDLDNIEAKDVPREVPNTFNKVVVKDKVGDELSKLGSEIDELVDTSKKVAKDTAYEKQMQKEIKERRNEMRIIIVRRGDTLSKIAKRAYGSGKEKYYKKILRANPGLIKNPNRIFVGQRLRVPN